jgi:6,7-dimethyl-8-ribityllumazine synthase
MRFLLVNAIFYQHISALLEKGATAFCDEKSIALDVIHVGGALEIPTAIAMAAHTKQYDGFIALGCVIRGETSHYDIVAQQSAAALQTLGITERVAIGNGILTVENEEQALKRAHPEQGNKGASAAKAALELAELRHKWYKAAA